MEQTGGKPTYITQRVGAASQHTLHREWVQQANIHYTESGCSKPTYITQRVGAASQHTLHREWVQHGETGSALCDRRMRVKLKGKVYKTVVRPALLYGAETWATKIGQEARLEVNEMRMLRWVCGVTRRDKIRNEYIRGTIIVAQVSKKITEKRPKWYGQWHVMRMKEGHIVRRMLDVDIPREQIRGQPNLRGKMRVRQI